ncbi:unnamed protein product [Urochloa decumbens]|uniref:[RNA-polymerase]-subunit kinase n=1 Tax=Urochloa decumbens TaxID=240449 RepID=A0ABC9CIU0_9POAL
MDTTEVATRLAAVCDLIEEHRKSGAPICATRAAAISAMIDDVAAAAATGGTRMDSGACSYEEVDGDDELGVGLSGLVVRARLRATGEDVAVKSLHADPGCGGGGIGRLLREACFMVACGGHPSLVALRGVAMDDGGHSLVMDYVGPNLLDVLRARGRRRPFPEADARRVMRQLLAGAVEMHRHGIVHRDIKPENVLVAATGCGGVVKICDLGSAKSTAERSPPADIAGTMEYMAPEVLARSACGHGVPADAWSLGCVMAELLTGEPPFRGEDQADQLREIFDVLGAPEESVWEAMRPRLSAVLASEVKQWRARQRQVRHRSRLREVIPGEVLSDEGFEVLKGLLTCDPEKRMTAAAALRCAWFADEVEEDARVPAAATSSAGCAMSLAITA